MNQGVLTQLVAVSPIDASVNGSNTDRHAIENIEYIFQNNKLDIDHGSCPSDLMTPLYIYSDHPIDFLEFHMQGSSLIISFPLTFCNILLNFENEVNEYLYKLPWDLLKIKQIPLIALQYCDISFKLITSHQCNAKLYVKQTFLENDARRIYAETTHDIIIKQFQEQEIQLDSNQHDIRLNLAGLIKGFFIDNINDIQEINNIKFLLNNNIRINYNKTMIQLFTKKISDRCIYIPLDNEDFNESTNNASLNCDRFDNISLRIDSNVNQNVTIRALNVNILKVMGGMAGLVYHYNMASLWTPNHSNVTIPNSTWVEDNKKIEGDTKCAICLSNIENENKYMTCTTCKKNFMEEPLREWLVKDNSCPLCRSEWTERIIYINN